MAGQDDKYNDTKARYLAMLAVQNMHNRNLGISYDRLIRQNKIRKGNIDFWLERIIAGEGQKNDS